MVGETVRLAEYAAGLRYEDLPGEVVAAAKDAIIDTVAACICGAALPWSRIVIDYAARTGPAGTSRILGHGCAVQAPAAALANGALAHAFELDSLTRPGAGAHPGATVLPPALAIAQQQGGAGQSISGKALIAAFVAGHDGTVRRGGRLRASARTRCGEDDKRDRHRRFARRRASRIREGRWRHGEAAASRARIGSWRVGREPGGEWLHRPAHRARRPVRLSARVLHRVRGCRADQGTRP